MIFKPTSRLVLLVVVGSLGCTAQDPGVGDSGAGGSAAGLSAGGSAAGTVSEAGSATQTVGGAGASAIAGAGGSNESGGSAGVATGGSSVGGGSGGASAAIRSAGCGMATTQALASWVEQPKLSVNAKDRQWWVWLPTGYDPTRAYPVVFTFHGCGGPDGYVPMQKATGSDAIVVRGTGGDTAKGCWTYAAEGDDVKFFDAMLAQLETQSCVDTSRVFAMGYSSGGWMTNTLECSRGDKLRATATLSGGRSGNGTNCKGKFARATVHDLQDPTNPFDDWTGTDGKVHQGQGASLELNRVLAQNHCMADVPPVMESPTPCARYQGCDAGYPVIACRTSGQGHNRQDALAEAAFWGLFSSL